MTKLVTRSVVVLGALVLVATACTPGADDEEGSLTWAIGGAESQPGGVHQDVAELWNEENPDTPIEIEILPEGADEQRQQQTLELNAEGTQFDVLGMDVIWTGEYSENGWLESLEDVRDQIEGQSLEAPFQSATWGGELWGAPYNSNAGFLYYRTDLVDEPPTTWDELREVGEEAAEEEGIAAFVGQGAAYEGFVVNWLEYYWSAGGELFNEDQTEVLFDEDIAIEVTEWTQEGFEGDFYAAGFNTAMEEEARSEFQAGNAVFMRNWPYAYDLMEDEEESDIAGDFDIAPLPTFTGEGTISALGGFNNAVSAFSENTDLAKEFVVWASTNEEVHRMLADRNTPPSLESVYEDEELQDDPVMALLGEVLPDSVPRPPAPDWNGISLEIQDEIFPAYNGDQDVETAVSNVADYLEGVLE
jgi:multiple sugar transport system substrate-binding protein